MVQTPWIFHGIHTMEPHFMGFHRGKNPWEIHGILVAQMPWIFHGAHTMELHSMGLHLDKKNPWKFCGEFPCLTFRGNEFHAGFIATRPTETSQKSMAYKS